jgi:adenosylcobinamide-phosphate guanylyltransferase
MCGGEGTRLDAAVEKPLYPVAGTPMVERVREALSASSVDRTFAITSPATPETARCLDCPTIETPGEGYVVDLGVALSDARVSPPVLTVAADLPALDAAAVDAVLDAARGALTVAVPVGRKRALGFGADTTIRHRGTLVAPAGVNVVGDGDALALTRDRRFAVNVNRPADARAATRLLSGSTPVTFQPELNFR